MLSICIPVYNSDASELVYELLKQIDHINFDAELLIIDDASSHNASDFRSLKHPKFKYIQNEINVGRSKIRNQFLNIAIHPYLLFIDGDSKILKNDFLQIYGHAIKEKEIKVLCGASIYQTQRPKREYYLRWKYSVIRESKSIDQRMKDKTAGFKTNNFIIEREVFLENPFNEKLRGYGHEDTLFGFQLREKKVLIDHIDNPVLNSILDSNEVFLVKAKDAVKNLHRILFWTNNNPTFVSNNKLCTAYIRLKRFKLTGIVHLVLSIFHPLNFILLKKGIFNMLMFDLYKLKLMIEFSYSKTDLDS